MKRYVFDSYALLAYAENESGSATVSAILKEALAGKALIFLSVINWGEMYYIAYREGGRQTAETYRTNFEQYPIKLVEAGLEHTQMAATLKATHKISYADAFAATLAKLKNAELVTGDPEFKQLENDIHLIWI
jgi:ribonuclease VapC